MLSSRAPGSAWSTCLAALSLICAWPADAVSQTGPGFRFAFGTQHMAGDMGNALDRAIDAEFSIMVPVSVLRLGGGANWASFDVVDARESWNQIRFHLLVGFPLRVGQLLRPYVEGRWTYHRLRPEDDRYFGGEDKLLRDFVAEGSGLEGVVGTEIVIGPRLSVDLSGAVASFGVSPDLSEEGFGPIDSGATWRAHLGVAWFPTNER